MSGILALLQAAPAAPPPGFWQQNGDKILVSVITAIVILILSEPIKAGLKKLGQWIENAFAGLGWRFRKRYLAALADRHRWLKLIGVYSQADPLWGILTPLKPRHHDVSHEDDADARRRLGKAPSRDG